MQPWFGKWKRCRMSKGDSKTHKLHIHMNIHERNILHLPRSHWLPCLACSLSLPLFLDTIGVHEELEYSFSNYDVHNGMRLSILFLLALPALGSQFFPQLCVVFAVFASVNVRIGASFLLLAFAYFFFFFASLNSTL